MLSGAGIARLVTEAQSKEAPVQRLADVVAGQFCFGEHRGSGGMADHARSSICYRPTMQADPPVSPHHHHHHHHSAACISCLPARLPAGVTAAAGATLAFWSLLGVHWFPQVLEASAFTGAWRGGLHQPSQSLLHALSPRDAPPTACTVSSSFPSFSSSSPSSSCSASCKAVMAQQGGGPAVQGPCCKVPQRLACLPRWALPAQSSADHAPCLHACMACRLHGGLGRHDQPHAAAWRQRGLHGCCRRAGEAPHAWPGHGRQHTPAPPVQTHPATGAGQANRCAWPDRCVSS